MPMLRDDTVLVGTPHCVVREQEDRCVVYNSRTDELHLIPMLGHYLYNLCDGLRDVGSICRAFSIDGPDRTDDPDAGGAARACITAYLEALVRRGILQEDRRG
jgi:hypothetical protein